MSGYCENCAKRKTCHKTIGKIFGFCNTDYIGACAAPKKMEAQK